MDGYDDNREYKLASERIDNTPELEPYRKTIMYDWQESGEHWAWIATASIQDIIDWAQSVEQDDADQEQIDSHQ